MLFRPYPSHLDSSNLTHFSISDQQHTAKKNRPLLKRYINKRISETSQYNIGFLPQEVLFICASSEGVR